MEDTERRKAIELLKEMRSEKKAEDDKSQGTRLNWMYKGPSDLVDREEYLLGKAIDKTFEVLNNAGTSDAVGRTGEQSNVPKKLLEKSSIESTEQVDIAKKILEDPLYAIKQKEMEARKKLLNNPVKLKQIKQMLLERSKLNSAKKHKKKKSKKKSEEDLNCLILKKLKKFTDKEKRKALSKVMQSDSESSSEESNSSSKEDKKHKLRRKRSHSSSEESDSSSESTSSSDNKNHKSKKRKSEAKNKKQNRKHKKSSSDSDSSDSYKTKKTKSKKSKKKKYIKKSSSSSSSDSSSDCEKSRKSTKKSHEKSKDEKRKEEKKKRVCSSPDKERSKKKLSKRNDSSDEGRKSKKDYGLVFFDGSKPAMRQSESSVQKYEKNSEPKAKYVPPPKAKPLSEKEREKKLKEMVEDAKLRKQDREKNLASHRKKQAQEEQPKDYDDDFMRRQMLELTSQRTMADRIKSNINNIQRSRSSMDSSFMRK